MALFQQDLQTQVISEQAVQEPSAIGAISGLAGAFLKAQPSGSTKGAPNYEQSIIANFATELNTLEALKESGSINEVDFSRRLGKARSEIAKIKDANVPQGLQNQYEVNSGRDFNSFGYNTNEEYEKANLLEGDFAKAIRPSVVSELEAAGQVATPDAVDNAVLNKLEDKTSLENDLNTQNKKLALGQPIDDTAVSKNIKADYDVLTSFFKDAASDGIVTKNEFLSAQLGVSNLMTTKYGQFKSNPKINSVMEQMTGLLDDIGKGVSDTPSAVLADTIQIALQNEGFSAGTIAVVRAMQEGKNIGQFQDIMANNKEGKTVADAMVFIAGADLTEDKLVEIFNTARRPSVADAAGTNPSLLSIPTVKDNPNEYQTVVDKFSESAKTPTSNDLLGNEKVRNSFLTSLNVAGSAVASQSDEYILGEKLLSKFASNSIVKNLEAVYSVDPQNAAQTNDVLQAGLSSERVRQSLELNNRLDAGAGAGQLVMADAEGKLQLNNEMIEKNKDKLVGGAAGWSEMQGKINAAGGLEKFLQLPPMVNSAINTDASIMVSGTQYLLKDIFSIDFNKVLKLSNNLKLIDSKLVNLESLATKYQDDTDMLRGRSTNLTPSQNAEVMAAINEGSNLGIPLEDIDFDSNAPATPAEPSGEIAVTPLDSDGNPTITLATPLQSGFDSLTESEGTDIHLDGRNIITLPYGIVPDKNSIKKSDGTVIDPTGTHGLKESDLTDIDYSGATKFGLSRSSYSSDEQFAKAVYVEFGKQAGENYGTGFKDLSDKAKEAAYDIAWNSGVKSTGWSSVKTMLDETSKDASTQTTDNLIGFTTNFKSGKEKVNNVSVNNYPRGLLKRRLTTYNLVAKTGEEAVDIVTTSVETNGKRTGTKYDIRKADGTVLKSWTKPDLNETLGTLSVN